MDLQNCRSLRCQKIAEPLPAVPRGGLTHCKLAAELPGSGVCPPGPDEVSILRSQPGAVRGTVSGRKTVTCTVETQQKAEKRASLATHTEAICRDG